MRECGLRRIFQRSLSALMVRARSNVFQRRQQPPKGGQKERATGKRGTSSRASRLFFVRSPENWPKPKWNEKTIFTASPTRDRDAHPKRSAPAPRSRFATRCRFYSYWPPFGSRDASCVPQFWWDISISMSDSETRLRYNDSEQRNETREGRRSDSRTTKRTLRDIYSL